MLRRGRNGHTRHLVWIETLRDTEAMAVVQPYETEDWEDQTTTQADAEAAARSSVVPVTGESFCQCPQEEPGPGVGLLGFSTVTDCLCGEEDQGFDWVWDEHSKSTGAFLSCDNRKVSFHSDYSCGTAAIRGTKELTDGQHFWEIKMTSPVYGTDMMVGIGTSEVNLEKFKHSFCSLLGHDEDSWGLSYTGFLQHKGDKVKFSSRFGQGSIIGVHLDTWHGTMTFYKNRQCIGRCFPEFWFAIRNLHNFLVMTAWWLLCMDTIFTLSCYLLRTLRHVCHQAAEQEVLPHGVLHCGQEQHEGDPCLLHTHFPAVPLLCPAPSDYDSCYSEPEDYQSKRCRLDLTL
uniref:SPRY domain-containing SOCS box protein 3 n=1 Tax=Myripristis murdjan TaxID=586833 RepID=A0A667X609_9TELE